jgi:hypothetical protein
LGIGFWVGLQANLNVAIQVLKDNTGPDTGHSGNDSDEDAFDDTENTVAELNTLITNVIATLKAS